MKLGIMYTVFNGLELLERNMMEVAPLAHYVGICYQKKSWQNEWMLDSDAKILNQIDCEKIEYHVSELTDAKVEERVKHNMMIQHMRKKGCTHFLLLACDEYFKRHELDWAMGKIETDVSFTHLYTYYKYPEWRLIPIEHYMKPFIHRLNDDTRITAANNYPCRVDPSVRVAPARSFQTFDRKEIMMHHYSMIRNNIQNKFMNAASKRNTSPKIQQYLNEYEFYDIDSNPGIEYFQGRRVEIVDNYFNI